MGIDIGPKIGIEGEREFKSALTAINSQLKAFAADMKAVSSAVKAGDDSMDAATRQTELLEGAISATEQKVQLLTGQLDRETAELKDLEDALQRATREFGDNSKEVSSAQNAYNRQVTTVNKLRAQLGDANASLSDMRGALKNADSAANDFDSSLGDVSGSLKDTADSPSGLVSGLADVKAGFDIAIGVISEIADAVLNAVSAFWGLADETEDYREQQARLNTAFSDAGFEADAAAGAYLDLYKVLGDSGEATQAAQLLATLSLHQQDLSRWTDIATGIYAKFGESIPIDGLYESILDTITARQVTGQLADALNRVGISEDDFNVALSQTSTAAERNHLIMGTLMDTYGDLAEAYRDDNAVMLESREAQALMNGAYADLGGSVADLKAKIQGDLTPALAGVVEALGGIVAGAPDAEEALTAAVDNAITVLDQKVPEYTEVGTAAIEAITNAMVDAAPELISAGMSITQELTKSMFKVIGGFFVGLGENIVDFFTGGADSTMSAADVSTLVRNTGSSSSYTAAQAAGAAATGYSGATTQTFNFQVDLDGQTLARQSFTYDQREAALRGTSLVEVPGR